MDTNYTQYVRCSDCGKNQTETSNTIDPTLTLSPTCLQTCCNVTSPIVDQKCTCPVDYTGDRCDQRKAYRCTIKLVSPNLDCGAIDASFETKKSIYTNPQCTRFRLKSTEFAFFQYSLSCAQNGSLTDATTPGVQNLSYWYRDSKVAFSVNPNMFLQFKIFNFFQLTDDSFSGYQEITQAYLSGTALSNFAMNFSRLPELRDRQKHVDYITGNRVYAEVGLASFDSLAGLEVVPYQRSFIDFEDVVLFDNRWTGKNLAANRGLGTAEIVVIVLGILAMIVLGAVMYQWRRLKQRSHRKTE